MASSSSAAASSATSGSFLDVDPISVPGCNFALISIVPSKDKKQFGLKIRGTFPDQESAAQYADKLTKMEGARFDIYLVECYKWLQVPPPDVNEIGSVVYADDRLNEIIKDYEKNRIGAKTLFEQRKLDVMRDGLDAHLAPEEKLPEPAPEDLAKGAHAVIFQEDDPITARHRAEDEAKQTKQTAE